MDTLLATFLTTLLAEQGDATQLLAVLALARFARAGTVAAGLAVAILANAGIAAAGGAAVRALVPYQATLLLVAMALVAAGGAALWRAKPPKVVLYDRLGAFGATALSAFVLGFGDKSQFLIFALAARGDAPLLAALGGAAGAFVGVLPALALGPAFARVWPARGLRYAAAGLLLVAGLWIALGALRLI